MRQIAYYEILGRPLIIYLGIMTLASFTTTAIVGYLNHKGKTYIPFKWHPRLAVFSITLAIIHGFLAFLSNI